MFHVTRRHLKILKTCRHSFVSTLCAVPALLHAQTDTGGITGLRCGDMVVFVELLAILLGLLCRDVGHAEDTGLYIETLRHLWAGVLHGHYGYLAHLVGATRNLNKDKESFCFRDTLINLFRCTDVLIYK